MEYLYSNLCTQKYLQNGVPVVHQYMYTKWSICTLIYVKDGVTVHKYLQNGVPAVHQYMYTKWIIYTLIYLNKME